MKTLDPRMKLLSILVITTMAILFFDPIWMLALSFAAACLCLVLRADFVALHRLMGKFLKLLFFLVLVQVVFVRTGEPVLSIGGNTVVFYDGLIRGLNTGMRYFVILCSAAIMAGENNRRVVASLSQMKIPYTFVFMVMITLRFLPLFMESFSNAMTSMQLRGVELKKVRAGQKIRLYGHLLFPVVADAIIRSQDLSMAMEARGFGAMKRRSAYLVVTMGFFDYAYLFVLLCATGAVFALYFNLI